MHEQLNIFSQEEWDNLRIPRVTRNKRTYVKIDGGEKIFDEKGNLIGTWRFHKAESKDESIRR